MSAFVIAQSNLSKPVFFCLTSVCTYSNLLFSGHALRAELRCAAACNGKRGTGGARDDRSRRMIGSDCEDLEMGRKPLVPRSQVSL